MVQPGDGNLASVVDHVGEGEGFSWDGGRSRDGGGEIVRARITELVATSALPASAFEPPADVRVIDLTQQGLGP